MSLKNETFVILTFLFLSFIYLRGFLNGVKLYQLNNSAYRKRKKGETFFEWLVYSRYKEEIPKVLRFLYFVVLISHPAAVMVCALLHLIGLSGSVDKMLMYAMIAFDVVWMLTIALLFWSSGPDFAYDRWIRKKRGMKRKRRK